MNIIILILKKLSWVSSKELIVNKTSGIDEALLEIWADIGV